METSRDYQETTEHNTVPSLSAAQPLNPRCKQGSGRTLKAGLIQSMCPGQLQPERGQIRCSCRALWLAQLPPPPEQCVMFANAPKMAAAGSTRAFTSLQLPDQNTNTLETSEQKLYHLRTADWQEVCRDRRQASASQQAAFSS